jgi:hypothetical protein
MTDLTVVGDDGAVWTHEHAWVMCLWATRRHRLTAERLARPHLLPLARGAASSAAGLRHLLGHGGSAGGDYADGCAGPCSAIGQG